jgi:hypothetical protein
MLPQDTGDTEQAETGPEGWGLWEQRVALDGQREGESRKKLESADGSREGHFAHSGHGATLCPVQDTQNDTVGKPLGS